MRLTCGFDATVINDFIGSEVHEQSNLDSGSISPGPVFL
jgi:hypothetical protein